MSRYSVDETAVAIAAADGVVSAVCCTPQGAGAWPGILFLTDIGGIRAGTTEKAHRLAAEGYVVLSPNVFYRNGEPPFFTPPVDLNDPATRARFDALAGALTPDAIERDAAAYVPFLKALPRVAAGPVAIVGHCFTGAVALRMAAARPDDVAFVASFHGGGLYADSPSSPHLVLPRVKARLYFAHADADRSMPAEAIEKLEIALRAWGGRSESELYPGALHGWTMPGHPAYNGEQAGRAFEKLTALLADVFHSSPS